MLFQSESWNYHERLEHSLTCGQELLCRGGKCLNSTQFCDGRFDCPGREDEGGDRCGVGGGLEVRVVGGPQPGEGRVEVCKLPSRTHCMSFATLQVRGRGGEWGGVCDDSWGPPEATVACREAGFPLGAREPVAHSVLYQLYRAVQVKLSRYGGTAGGRIWLDEVNCKTLVILQ